MIRFRARRAARPPPTAESKDRMANATPITVAHGDGIGPEIMAATLAHSRRRPAPASTIEDDRDRREGLPRAATAPASSRRRGIRCAARRSSSRRRSRRRRAAASRASTSRRARRSASTPTSGPASRYHPFVATKHPVHGRRHRARERRGPVRRHRVPPDRPTSTQCLKLITPPGLREDRPLRLRVRRAGTTARRSPASPKTTS